MVTGVKKSKAMVIIYIASLNKPKLRFKYATIKYLLSIQRILSQILVLQNYGKGNCLTKKLRYRYVYFLLCSPVTFFLLFRPNPHFSSVQPFSAGTKLLFFYCSTFFLEFSVHTHHICCVITKPSIQDR